LPNINWSNPVLVSSRDYCSTLFSTLVSQLAYEQYVSENTRPSTKNAESGSLLDIVLCNDAFAISNVHVTQPFSTSDHFTVSFNHNFINNQLFNASASYTWYNFKDVDWNAVNAVLAVVDWSCVFSTCMCMDWMIVIKLFMLLSMTVLITTFHILPHLVLAVALNIFILGLSDASKVKNVKLGDYKNF